MWPLPKLLPVVEGEIMDYGYDDEAVFVMPLKVPEDASGSCVLKGLPTT
jgi:DsbC/DsbD-like thiol-disulfide interchange protein